jgi:autotransporter-associated beta strand protein
MRLAPTALRAAAILLAAPIAVSAAEIVKAANTTSLNLGTSWVGGTGPGVNDIAVWNSTTAANSTALGGNVSWLGIKISNPTGLITIGTTAETNNLTLGASGIDMSAATQNLLINSNLIVNAAQTWSVAAGRTLQIQTINTARTLSGSGDISLVNSTGSGVAIFDFRPGTSGSTSFSAQSGFSGFSGDWTIGANTFVKTLRNGINAWGTGTVTLAGGTVAQQANFSGTWNNTFILQAGTTSTIDDSNNSGTRTLKLLGTMSGSGNLVIAETGPANYAKNGGVVVANATTISGTVTINNLGVLRVGGVGTAASTDLSAGTTGTLGTASVVINSGGALTLSRSNTWSFSNAISGAGTLYIGGAVGALVSGASAQNVTLADGNTYSGGTELVQGALSVSDLSGIGTGYLAVKNGATFNYGGGTASTTRLLYLNSGASTLNVTDADAVLTWNDAAAKTGGLITKGGAGTLALGGAIGVGASVAVSGGTLSLSGANTYTGATSIASGATLEVAGSGSLAATAISGQGALRMAGTGTLTLSSASNSYTGGTTVAGGTLALGAAGVLADSGSVAVSGGTLDLGGFAESVGAVTLSSGTIQNGTLTSSTGFGLSGGTVAANAVLAGSAGLDKTGAGSATVSGTHTYSGPTAVSGGTLVLASGASLASTAYEIGDGATLETADAFVLGTGKTLALGALSSVVSAAKTGDLTLSGGTIGFDFGVSTHDQLAVSGDLALSSGSFAFAKSGSYTGGVYDLLSYGGAFSGDETALTLSGLSSDGTSRQTFALLHDSANKLIQLDVGGQAETVLWTGASSVWDAGGSGATNWSVQGAYAGTEPNRFFNGDSVLFDGTASTGTVEVDAAGIVAGAITVSSSSLDYTFGGSGLITAGALAKSGSSSLTVANANTFAGGTNLSAGRIRLGADNALGSGVIAVSGGSISSDGASARSLANAVVFSGDAALGHGTDSGALTLSGSVDLGGARVLEVLSDAVLSGIVSNGSLEKVGSGNLTLSASGTYDGGTTVTAGTLTLGASDVLANAGSVTVAGGTLDIGANSDTVGALSLTSGSISGAGTLTVASASFDHTGSKTVAALLAGAGTLTKAGDGTLTLSGANTYSGATLVSAGTLELGHASALGTTAAGTTVSTGATLDLKGFAIGAETLSLGGALVNSSGTAVSHSGAITLTSGASLGGAGNLTVSSVLAGANAGFTKSGAGTLELTAAATLNGAVTVSEGTLKFTGSGAIASASGVAIASGATLDWARAAGFGVGISGAGTFRRSTSGNATISGGAASSGFTGTWEATAGYLGFVGDASLGDTSANLSLSGGGGIYFTTTGNTLAATRTVTLGTGGGALNGSTGNTNTFGAKFTGAGGLIKVSGETAVLTNPDNDFTGDITISGGGTLEVGDAGRLGSGSYAGAISNPNTLRFSTSANQTLTGVLSGAGALQKSGSGTLTLSATNSHSGNVSVSDGVLEVTSTGQLFAGTFNNSSTVTVSGGATLRLASFAYGAAGGLGQLADYGARRVLNGGGIEISGNSHSSGNNFQVANGATGFLNVTTSGQTLTLAGNANDNIALGGALTVAGAGNLTINEIIGNNTGAGSILKSGAGTLTLGAANTFSGGVSLSEGSIVVGNAAGLGSGAVSVSGGSLDLGGLAVGNAITLSGGTLSDAANYAGALTLGGNATVGGSVGGTFGTGTDTSRIVSLSGGAATFTGTLKGVGTLAGDVTVSGAHTPGNSPGVQTIDGDLTYTGTPTVTWELIGNTASGAGTNFDQIVVTGNLDFSVATSLTLVFDLDGSSVDWNDAFWDTARSWVVYDVTGETTSFGNLSITDALASYDGKLVNDTVLDSNGASLDSVRTMDGSGFYLAQVGSDVRLFYRPVPEPSTYGLILGALALAGAAVRRRKNSK